jgi:tetratricopeptide (TPR) repeat protein
MTGRATEEIREYLEAARLGLHKWDLFLNLGLVYSDHNELPKATSALETAVILGPDHPEGHFNLAIAYERAKGFPRRCGKSALRYVWRRRIPTNTI